MLTISFSVDALENEPPKSQFQSTSLSLSLSLLLPPHGCVFYMFILRSTFSFASESDWPFVAHCLPAHMPAAGCGERAGSAWDVDAALVCISLARCDQGGAGRGGAGQGRAGRGL